MSEWARNTVPRVGVVDDRVLRRGGSLLEELHGHVELVRVDLPDVGSTEPNLAGCVLGPGLPRPSPPPPYAAVDQLGQAVAREHFVEQVFAQARLLALFDRRWSVGELVEFHTDHKLQLFGHDDARYRRLGRLVAHVRDRGPAVVATEYAQLFTDALAVPATRGRCCDTLLHAVGHLPGGPSDDSRRQVLAHVEAYRRGEVSLLAVVQRLRRYAFAAEVGYLMRQTFLAPYPEALWHLRDQV